MRIKHVDTHKLIVDANGREAGQFGADVSEELVVRGGQASAASVILTTAKGIAKTVLSTHTAPTKYQ
jgi:hypothetical protein